MQIKHAACAVAAVSMLMLGYFGWQWLNDIEIGDVPSTDGRPASYYYLKTVTPPCESNIEGAVDPCARTDEVAPVQMTLASRSTEGSPPTLEEILTRADEPEYSSHIVFRGTLAPGSTRCADYDYRPVAEIPADLAPALRRDDFRVLLCFTDVNVHEYLVGNGYPNETVSTAGHTYWEAEYGSESEIRSMISNFRRQVAAREEGREKVLFIGPSFTNASQSWIAYNSWDVQKTGGGDIVAVAPHLEDWLHDPDARSNVVIPLDEFVTRIAQAHAAKIAKTDGRISVAPDSPDLVLETSRLMSWFRRVGATSDPENRPEPPPPAP